MYVALTAQTTGWVGLGFGEAAAMRGADIAVAHVDGQGKAHVADYHAIGNRAPIMDGTWASYGRQVGPHVHVFN